MAISRSTAPSNGFTFVEILVALLVLSVGLLGLAGLQVSGIRNNHSAYLRSQAVMLAQDMADRMRANQAGASAGNYDISSHGDFSTSNLQVCDDTLAVANPSCTTDCTTKQLAERAAFEWNALVVSELPSGRACLCRDLFPNDNVGCDFSGSVYTITVSWAEGSSGGASSTVQLRVQP